MKIQYPAPPSHIGIPTKRLTIDRMPMEYTVKDEIIRVPASNNKKALYLQLLKFADGREEMRLCYWMISQKGRVKGRWVFGQFATMIAKEDFEGFIIEAKRRRWISSND